MVKSATAGAPTLHALLASKRSADLPPSPKKVLEVYNLVNSSAKGCGDLCGCSQFEVLQLEQGVHHSGVVEFAHKHALRLDSNNMPDRTTVVWCRSQYEIAFFLVKTLFFYI